MMPVGEILADWRREEFAFPEAAFRSAVAERNEIVPILLAELERLAGDPRRLRDAGENRVALFGLYLLAAFREPRTPAILYAILSRTGLELHELWGDDMAADAPRLFASWAATAPGELYPFAENAAFSQDLRAAVLEAFVIQLLHGVGDPDVARRLLVRLGGRSLRREADGPDAALWHAWARCCVDHGFAGLLPLVREAYAKRWIDPALSTWNEEEEILERGREAVLERSRAEHGSLIDDAAAELRGWHRFGPEARREEEERRRLAAKRARIDAGDGLNLFRHADTIAGGGKRRPNEPCPCGSGRKYKKCCGRG